MLRMVKPVEQGAEITLTKLVGDFKNEGREWHPKRQPEEVQVHDFKLKELGKAIPYGLYDVQRNAGWVSVGVSHETAAFAVATIGRWWKQMGFKSYPKARSLQIVADSSSNNGSRVRLWKWELQKLANKTGLAISVSHLPPGTSKWNKIEHRLFSYITQNWRGKPLLTHATIVNLISSTRTKAGLTVRCVLDRKHYPLKVDVTDEQMATIRITRDDLRLTRQTAAFCPLKIDNVELAGESIDPDSIAEALNKDLFFGINTDKPPVFQPESFQPGDLQLLTELWSTIILLRGLDFWADRVYDEDFFANLDEKASKDVEVQLREILLRNRTPFSTMRTMKSPRPWFPL